MIRQKREKKDETPPTGLVVSHLVFSVIANVSGIGMGCACERGSGNGG